MKRFHRAISRPLFIVPLILSTLSPAEALGCCGLFKKKRPQYERMPHPGTYGTYTPDPRYTHRVNMLMKRFAEVGPTGPYDLGDTRGRGVTVFTKAVEEARNMDLPSIDFVQKMLLDDKDDKIDLNAQGSNVPLHWVHPHGSNLVWILFKHGANPFAVCGQGNPAMTAKGDILRSQIESAQEVYIRCLRGGRRYYRGAQVSCDTCHNKVAPRSKEVSRCYDCFGDLPRTYGWISWALKMIPRRCSDEWLVEHRGHLHAWRAALEKSICVALKQSEQKSQEHSLFVHEGPEYPLRAYAIGRDGTGHNETVSVDLSHPPFMQDPAEQQHSPNCFPSSVSPSCGYESPDGIVDW